MCNASIIVVGEKQCTGTTIAPSMTKQMISLFVVTMWSIVVRVT